MTKYSTANGAECRVPDDQPDDVYTRITLVSVSKIICPVKGELGRVDEVHTVTTPTCESSLSVVIEELAILFELTAPVAILSAVTAPLCISSDEMLATPRVAACIDQIEPSHVHVRVPKVYVSPGLGLDGNESAMRNYSSGSVTSSHS
jgi:hypothetical protein